VLDHENKQL